MISQTTSKFWELYYKLPLHVQEKANKAYQMWCETPDSTGLYFKRVGKTRPVYSVRVGEDYRSLGLLYSDTVMFPLFTLHGSGHNPRGVKTQRVRQRFMHKLKYFLDKYDKGTMCVGCGRCVQSCPVNIDIREVCNIMNNYEPKK